MKGRFFLPYYIFYNNFRTTRAMAETLLVLASIYYGWFPLKRITSKEVDIDRLRLPTAKHFSLLHAQQCSGFDRIDVIRVSGNPPLVT